MKLDTSKPCNTVQFQAMDSPVEHMLGTNLAPTDAQANEIREVLGKKAAELNDIEAAMEQLRCQRDEIRRFIESHRALLSPIRKMPLEILGEIFIRCLPEGWYPVPHPTDAPLLLCQVCGSWRRIAFSVPSLWTRLLVPVSRRAPQLDLLRTWLNCSGICPLSFEISCVTAGSDHLSDVIRLFLPHVARWKVAFLELSSAVRQRSLEFPAESALTLEDLKVVAEDGEWHEWVSHVIEGTTSLRSLSWSSSSSGPRRIISQSNFHASWSQLTDLSLFCPMEIEDILDLLSRCCMLRTCTFGDVDITSSLQNTTPTLVSHPSLTRLELNLRCRKEGLGVFFDHLDLPALDALDIYSYLDDDPSDPWPRSQFASLLSRSGCPLRRLFLSDVNVHEQDLISGLRCTSDTLVELHIAGNFVCATDTTLSLLTYRGSNDREKPTCLASRLEAIHLTSVSSLDGALTEMIESRWNSTDTNPHIARLSNVHVELSGFSTHAIDRKRWKLLKRRGIEGGIF